MPKDLWNQSTDFYNNNSVFAPQIYEFMVNFTNMQDQVKENWFCEVKKTELLGHYYDITIQKEDILMSMLQKV